MIAPNGMHVDDVTNLIDRAMVWCRENRKPDHVPRFRVRIQRHHKQKIETTHLITLNGDGTNVDFLSLEPRMHACQSTIADKYGDGDYTVAVEVFRRGGTWGHFGNVRFQHGKAS